MKPETKMSTRAENTSQHVYLLVGKLSDKVLTLWDLVYTYGWE